MPGTTISERRWFPTGAPQTLQYAVALLYWNAAISLIFGLVGGLIGRFGLILILGDVAGGFGIANERKWGYLLGTVVAVLTLALYVLSLPGSLFSVLFAVALIVLLLHPVSRSYYKVWFR